MSVYQLQQSNQHFYLATMKIAPYDLTVYYKMRKSEEKKHFLEQMHG